MADFFLSYNGADVAKAEWVAWTLRDAGYAVRFAKWELGAGYDIAQWMAEALEDSRAMVCVASPDYLKPAAKYSALERAAMLWRDVEGQKGQLIFIKIRPCDLPTIFATRSYISITGKSRDEARSLLLEGIKPPSAPAAEPAFHAEPATPSPPKPVAAAPKQEPAFDTPAEKPAGKRISNIPIQVPAHFLGRKEDLAAIDKAFRRQKNRLAAVALHGIRGVGKTTLAAAWAERHADDYRVTWWIRAQTPEGMRADLVGLGVRLGWVAADAQEQPALPQVLERLGEAGDGMLLVYDNARDAAAIAPFLPKRGAARVLVTSNSHVWRGRAETVEIRHWPKDVGAAYLIARTGRDDERATAEALSEALGGLPLAHEQAAAYCERLSVPFADYLRRFEAEPARLLDDARHAPAEYHDGLTVAKTFALAIGQAAKLHAAAGPLLAHAAILAPEPIPLFLFADGREHLDEPLRSLLAGDGLDEALAALAIFALVEQESVADERDPSIVTRCFRLHRLIRQVAAGGADVALHAAALTRALKMLSQTNADSTYWPSWRRLDPHAQLLAERPDAAESDREAGLLDRLASYRHNALAAYGEARILYERALVKAEQAFGPDDINTAIGLNNLAYTLHAEGDLEAAAKLNERALKIIEAVEGPAHPRTAASLGNLAAVFMSLGRRDEALPLFERALAAAEAAFGPDDIGVAAHLNNLGHLLRETGNMEKARPLLERALAIREKVRGPTHGDTAASLNNLGSLLLQMEKYDEARPLFERALKIVPQTLGPDHPIAFATLENLAVLELRTGNKVAALDHAQTSLARREALSGATDPATQRVAGFVARVLDELGRGAEAEAVRAEYGLGKEA
ncbi:MAG: FxSxx-COOH system tetratricopeptide repeat protein [Rhizobiaceae bacterium]